MREAESLARLRLARSEGVGPGTFRRLLARHGGAAAALDGLAAERLVAADPDRTRREHDAVTTRGGSWLHLGGPGYPPLLALAEDAPPVLAVLGDPALLLGRGVAVVGARNASAAGLRIAEELAEGLSAACVTIHSGLARGVDAAAHRGGLTGPGRTVGVLAGGLDVAYPPENRSLQERIAAEGALVAENPLGTAPLARHFPKRNRIVAGLSLGVAVVEAALRSGTLITSRFGNELGREIYAVPGSPLDPRCQGSNDLLRQGAHLCERASDVLETLPASPHALPLFRPRRTAPPAPAAGFRAAAAEPPDPGPDLLDLIGPTPVPVDEVLRRCHLPAPSARALLSELELEGRIQTLPGNRVVRLPA